MKEDLINYSLELYYSIYMRDKIKKNETKDLFIMKFNH
jgi:hypothetical protein